MGATLYIVVEGEDPGFDIFVNGRALARNEDALEKMAQRIGSNRCWNSFLPTKTPWPCCWKKARAIPEWAKTLPPPQWFSPEDGLITVCTLLDHLKSSPTALGTETPAVLREMEEFERVLRKTAQRQMRWQLAVSWK